MLYHPAILRLRGTKARRAGVGRATVPAKKQRNRPQGSKPDDRRDIPVLPDKLNRNMRKTLPISPAIIHKVFGHLRIGTPMEVHVRPQNTFSHEAFVVPNRCLAIRHIVDGIGP